MREIRVGPRYEETTRRRVAIRALPGREKERPAYVRIERETGMKKDCHMLNRVTARALGSSALFCGLILYALCLTRSADAIADGVHTSAADGVRYVSRHGDTLEGIARQYLRDPRDWTQIARLNRLRPGHLPAGVSLLLPADLLATEPLTARVVAMSGPVARAFGSNPFMPLSSTVTLTEGDRVRTGHDGFVTLEFSDGSHVSMPPDSTIELATLRLTRYTSATTRIIELRQGEVDSGVSHATRRDDRFEIHSPSVVAGVRGTHFRVSHDMLRNMTAIEVLDGAVGVDAVARSGAPIPRPGELSVQAGSGNVTRTGSTPGTPVPLLEAPVVTDPQKIQDGERLVFSMSQIAAAHGYRVQIGRDAGMLDIIAEERTTMPTASFGAVHDGRYFVRVSAVDASGLEGMPRTYAFERRLNSIVAWAAPDAQGDGYEFRWRRSGSAIRTRYRFTLARAANLRDPLVDHPDIDEDHFVVHNLPPGEYYWTVTTEQFENGEFYQKTSDVSSFTVAH